MNFVENFVERGEGIDVICGAAKAGALRGSVFHHAPAIVHVDF